MEKKYFEIFNELNKDKNHFQSNDDICTPMECVEKMINYIPNNFWNENIRILDPCCGNGNFGAGLLEKVNEKQIFYNDINNKRIENLKKILNPSNITKKSFFNIDSKFDLIIGNPPYSGGGNKNKPLFIEFINHSIDILNENGILCFITPNTFMSFNNSGILQKLFKYGSFLVIDNDVKKYFSGVGSSFSIFVWKKNTQIKYKTKIFNNYLGIKNFKEVSLNNQMNYLPLYIDQNIINLQQKITLKKNEQNNIKYRCDLHNWTKRELLKDLKSDEYQYKTIHTPNKYRWSSIKQEDFEEYKVILPLSTYYKPFIEKNINVTQGVAYLNAKTKKEAEGLKRNIDRQIFKLFVHLTRYGNFNNLKVIRNFNLNVKLDEKEINYVKQLLKGVKYYGKNK
ncbi:class I SAM-dependent methyltransferase [Mesoplasma florum]|uniref:class I SAM-dependent methyltransferase n=1 Tax=Mesoplasma florum TaxID=2151 RepID=UPI000BE3B90C|nr:class I SAM-dependent methyltransferase [Mesoplasma florum]ATI73941.1 hypothetical protein CQZ70_01585 [Mesoplasma florum]